MPVVFEQRSLLRRVMVRVVWLAQASPDSLPRKFRIRPQLQVVCIVTQFASTLYPQTNPSNPILLAVRDHAAMYFLTQAEAASRFLNKWELLLVVEHAPRRQREQAYRVLERIENFSG